MDCFYSHNPFSGFASQHGPLCGYENGEYCITAATHHARFPFACLNVCQAHAEKLSKRKDCEIEEGIIVAEIAKCGG